MDYTETRPTPAALVIESDAVRRIRVASIRAILGDYDSKEAFARAAGISASYLSQILNDDFGNHAAWRPVTEKGASKIEARLSLPIGWLSIDHSAPPQPPATIPAPALLPIIELMEVQHETDAQLRDAIDGLRSGVECTHTLLQIVLLALWEHDHELREMIERAMRETSSQATLCGLSGLSEQAQSIRDLARDTTCDRRLATRETIARRACSR